LRIIYDPFPAYLVDWNGFRIETDASIHFFIFTLGMWYYARNLLQNEPNFMPFRAVRLSFASGFLAIALFQSVDIFVTYSISGIWQSLLRSAVMMGAYCSVVCYMYFAFKKKGDLGIATLALMAWLAFSWVLLHFWKV
jgi:hypothetical protein